MKVLQRVILSTKPQRTGQVNIAHLLRRYITTGQGFIIISRHHQLRLAGKRIRIVAEVIG